MCKKVGPKWAPCSPSDGLKIDTIFYKNYCKSDFLPTIEPTGGPLGVHFSPTFSMIQKFNIIVFSQYKTFFYMIFLSECTCKSMYNTEIKILSHRTLNPQKSAETPI